MISYTITIIRLIVFIFDTSINFWGYSTLGYLMKRKYMKQFGKSNVQLIETNEKKKHVCLNTVGNF